jgi:RNA polymerase sigma factor (TIGR02999 family)
MRNGQSRPARLKFVQNGDVMTPNDPAQVTRILQNLETGDDAAAAQLLPLVYEELRALAGLIMKQERPDHTLQPTALVHEAFVRLVGAEDLKPKSRIHFKALIARAMRRLLINHARDRAAIKRGGPDRVNVALDSALAQVEERVVDVLIMDEALKKLADRSERQAQLVELRFFGDLTMEEAAQVLGISLTTAKADWTIARAWLGRELSDAHDQ